jgi:hypothetical protein
MNEPHVIDAQRYAVTVGFSQVIVEGHNREEALSAARSKLSQQSPRLWDVIFKMDANRFQVDPVT